MILSPGGGQNRLINDLQLDVNLFLSQALSHQAPRTLDRDWSAMWVLGLNPKRDLFYLLCPVVSDSIYSISED